MEIKGGMIVLIVCFAIAAGIRLEEYATKRVEHIEILQSHVAWQDSIITSLRTQNDSLRITITEFENAVKLLELNRADLRHFQ